MRYILVDILILDEHGMMRGPRHHGRGNVRGGGRPSRQRRVLMTLRPNPWAHRPTC